MFKIGICVEDKQKRERIKEEVIRWKTKYGIQVHLNIYANGENFAFGITDEDTQDILFVDVCNDSIKTQMAIREYKNNNITTNLINLGIFEKNNVLKMYELQSTYINYPLDKEQVYELLKREYRRYYTDDESYVFMNRPKYIKLSLKKVLYFSSIQRKVKAVCLDGTVHEFYKQLDTVEEELREKKIKFVRTHQSHLVNPEFIKGYCGNEIILKNGDKITIAATRRRRVRLQFQMLDIRR